MSDSFSGRAVLPGDIVQITDEKHHWFPCLIVVSELRSWGVQGFAFMPSNDADSTGQAYIRLNDGAYEPIGASALVLPADIVAERTSAIEARGAATGNTDAVHESAVPQGDAQSSTPSPSGPSS